MPVAKSDAVRAPPGLNTKVLFSIHLPLQWQNFRPSLLRFVNNCVESNYKTQKTRTKVLLSAMVGEWHFNCK